MQPTVAITEAQIIAIPCERKAELVVANLRRMLGVGPATFYGWKAKFCLGG